MRRSDPHRGANAGRGRAGAGLATLASCVLLLGACTSPVAELGRAGGPLADGFEIDPGSVLIGPVFPAAYAEGSQALIGLSGELQPVFEGYVRQAENLGYSLESGTRWGDPRRPEGQWCSDPDDSSADDPIEIRCSAYSSSSGGPTVSLTGAVEPDGRGYIHLVTGQRSDAQTPTLPRHGPRAAATDVEVAADLATDWMPLYVVEGSELLVEPLPGGCNYGSYIAVLRVTGDLTQVMRGYLRQFARVGAGGEGLVGAENELSVAGEIAGGGSVSAVGVKGDPSHVLIERCVLN